MTYKQAANLIFDQNGKYLESEIFYTGGGIWCGVFRIPFTETYFSGELNSWGTIYKSKKSALEFQGESDPDFIRYIGDNDFTEFINLWKRAILTEQTNKHGLACYVGEWLEENERIRKLGSFEY